MKNYKVHIIWLIVAIVALISGIFWGRSMATTNFAAGRTGRFGLSSSTAGFAGRTGTTGANGGFTLGQVTAVTGNSFTLQLANGNSENVFYSTSTQVIVPQPASISSVQPGTMVMITGTANSDGSMTASSIQVRNNGTTGGMSATGTY